MQCLVLVRDDFYAALNRFFQKLEIPILEGHNSALVDLFDVQHARKVLIAFGRSFGKLPQLPAEPNAEQMRFVESAVEGLADDGKVICVRLALFADMMKGKAWTVAALREAGGAKGVGIAFLEETFSSSTAPPEHRYHQHAARAVLQALLPDSDVAIKGQMKSIYDLRHASGYVDRPKDFQDLIRILDSEVRLITPTDPLGSSAPATSGAAGERHQCYQLTHDYLVYALREWLTTKQKATRRGRAELRLQERAIAWRIKQENRQLPALWEYVQILIFTSRFRWTVSERAMMAVAGRRHAFRSAVVGTVLVALMVGAGALRHHAWQTQQRVRVEGLIDQLLVADIAELPRIASTLEHESHSSSARLNTIVENPSTPQSDRLRAAFVLANRPGPHASRLIDYAASCDLATLAVIHSRLAPFAAALADELWNSFHQEPSTSSAQLRQATLLALSDPAGEQWSQVAPTIARALLAENSLQLDAWANLLSPAAAQLVPELCVRYRDREARSPERDAAARVLARYADPTLLSELILEADAAHFPTLFSGTARHGAAIPSILRRKLENAASADADPATLARQRRNATVALLRLGVWSAVEPQLTATADSTLRTTLMLELRDFGLTSDALLEAHENFEDPTARQAMLLAMGLYRQSELPARTEARLAALLRTAVRDVHNPAVRSAAEWLLRLRGEKEEIARANSEAARGAQSADRSPHLNSWVNTEGHFMVILRAPIEFSMGSPVREPGREDNEPRVQVVLTRSFAIAAHEVTVEQFDRFQPSASAALNANDPLSCPANKLTVVAAMRYCRWLSEHEGTPDDQMCYPAQEAIEAKHCFLSEERLARTGYRLPTEAEWEVACRAGTTTPWFFGDKVQHLRAFAWYQLNSDSRLHPTGTQMPSQLGLFDMSGNVSEWCQPVGSESTFVLRGGTYQNPPERTRSARRYTQSPTGYSFTGLRIARTMPVNR